MGGPASDPVAAKITWYACAEQSRQEAPEWQTASMLLPSVSRTKAP
jgi:hypothetical protein